MIIDRDWVTANICKFKNRIVNLPDNTTDILSDAFSGTSITEITIPSSVEYIQQSSFKDCQSLKTVHLNEGLKGICQYAFSGCSSLEDITLPESVYFLQNNVFEDCVSLREIKLPKSIAVVDTDLFDGCKKLERITIKNEQAVIERKAFYDSYNLTIICDAGSTAEKFAHDYEIKCIAEAQGIELAERIFYFIEKTKIINPFYMTKSQSEDDFEYKTRAIGEIFDSISNRKEKIADQFMSLASNAMYNQTNDITSMEIRDIAYCVKEFYPSEVIKTAEAAKTLLSLGLNSKTPVSITLNDFHDMAMTITADSSNREYEYSISLSAKAPAGLKIKDSDIYMGAIKDIQSINIEQTLYNIIKGTELLNDGLGKTTVKEAKRQAERAIGFAQSRYY